MTEKFSQIVWEPYERQPVPNGYEEDHRMESIEAKLDELTAAIAQMREIREKGRSREAQLTMWFGWMKTVDERLDEVLALLRAQYVQDKPPKDDGLEYLRRAPSLGPGPCDPVAPWTAVHGLEGWEHKVLCAPKRDGWRKPINDPNGGRR